jgi:hypothetical protein
MASPFWKAFLAGAGGKLGGGLLGQLTDRLDISGRRAEAREAQERYMGRQDARTEREAFHAEGRARKGHQYALEQGSADAEQRRLQSILGAKHDIGAIEATGAQARETQGAGHGQKLVEIAEQGATTSSLNRQAESFQEMLAGMKLKAEGEFLDKRLSAEERMARERVLSAEGIAKDKLGGPGDLEKSVEWLLDQGEEDPEKYKLIMQLIESIRGRRGSTEYDDSFNLTPSGRR